MSKEIIQIGSQIHLLKEELFYIYLSDIKLKFYKTLRKNRESFVVDATEILKCDVSKLSCTKSRKSQLTKFKSFFNKDDMELFGYLWEDKDYCNGEDYPNVILNYFGNSKQKYLIGEHGDDCVYFDFCITNNKHKRISLLKNKIKKLKKNGVKLEESSFVDKDLYKVSVSFNHDVDCDLFNLMFLPIDKQIYIE